MGPDGVAWKDLSAPSFTRTAFLASAEYAGNQSSSGYDAVQFTLIFGLAIFLFTIGSFYVILSIRSLPGWS